MNANTPQGMHSLQGSRTPPGMYWSAAESARQCGVSRATIDRAIKAGKLAADKNDEGAWRISPHALIEAGLGPGKPSPPDPAYDREDRDEGDTLTRLRIELVEARAEARVLEVERDAERRLRVSEQERREAVERERDRMLEAPLETAANAPQATAQPASAPTPGPAPEQAPRSNVGRVRRAWNVLRY